MRFLTVKLRGLSEAFRNDVEVNFDKLGPGLIAIVGENGAGKSTLIGSLFASLYRQLPGQKRPLYDFATHAQPEIDVCFSVNGERYRSQLKINPQARQMESYLFQADGKPLSDGKKESFQDCVQRLVGSRTLYEASIFSNQKRAGNFLSLERAQRKEVFVSQLLGLERLRRLSAMAKSEGESMAREAMGLDGERKALLNALNEQTRLGETKHVNQALEDTSAALETRDEERRGLASRLGELQKELGALESLEANRSGVIRRRDSIAGEIAAMERAIGEDERVLARRSVSNGTRLKLTAIADSIKNLHSRIEEAQASEAANRQVEEAIRTVAVELTAKRSELDRARTECEELARVPCQGRGEFAHCPKIQRAIRAQQELPQLEGTIATLELERHVHEGGLVQIVASSAQLLDATREAEKERQKLEVVVRQQEELKAVEARHAERLETLRRLERQRSAIGEELLRLDQEISLYNDRRQTEMGLRRRLKEVEGELRSLQARRENLLAEKAQLEQARVAAVRNRERLQTLEDRLCFVRQERDDWDYLARVFGADEIQLLEIQSAGPELSELVNDLLEGCLDNKFEVRFRTPAAEGRRPRVRGRLRCGGSEQVAGSRVLRGRAFRWAIRTGERGVESGNRDVQRAKG
jgi:exonuclease SbcC